MLYVQIPPAKAPGEKPKTYEQRTSWDICLPVMTYYGDTSKQWPRGRDYGAVFQEEIYGLGRIKQLNSELYRL